MTPKKMPSGHRGNAFLGKHPESGKTVLVRIGRYGPLAQIGDPEDEEKEFASLLKTQSLESITMERGFGPVQAAT